MMDALFENSYIKDKAWVKESYRYAYFRRPILVVCYCLLAFFFVFGAVDSIRLQYVNWGLIVGPIFMALYVTFMYNKSVRTMIKRISENDGKPIEVETFVYDDRIVQQNSIGTEKSLKYEDIRKAVVTKNYIYLVTRSNLMYTFDPDGFSVGTKSDFLAFLADKQIQIK